jgi:hypothetical protein
MRAAERLALPAAIAITAALAAYGTVDAAPRHPCLPSHGSRVVLRTRAVAIWRHTSYRQVRVHPTSPPYRASVQSYTACSRAAGRRYELATLTEDVQQVGLGGGVAPLDFSARGPLLAYVVTRTKVPPGQYRVPKRVIVLNVDTDRRLSTDLSSGLAEDVVGYPPALRVGPGGTFAYILATHETLGVVDGNGNRVLCTGICDFVANVFQAYTFTWSAGGNVMSTMVTARGL